MISFEHPIVLLIAVPVVSTAILFWRGGYDNLGVNRRRLALAIRVIVLAALILGLAGLAINLPQSRQAVVVVADLSASDARQRSTIENIINHAATGRPAGDRLGVVSVARGARVEQPVSSLSTFNGFQTTVDPSYTNLAAGLTLGQAILPEGYSRRVTVITDGRQNAGDALSSGRLIHSLGVHVDVWPTGRGVSHHRPEVRVDAVDVPPAIRAKESFSLDVMIHSNIATAARLDLYRDRTFLLTRREQLQRGENRFSFGQSHLRPGFHTYQVEVTPRADTQPQNNEGSAFTIVAGPPRVLVVAPSRSVAGNVLRSLRTTGIHSTFQYPSVVAPGLPALAAYAAVVLVDTPADDLTPGVTDSLVPYVRDLGRGLVVIGGNETYGMGDYGQSGLETALPVKMDLPKRKDLPTAAVVLVIESLEANYQIDISKQAGKAVINLLNSRDQVAVSDAQQNGHFAVPLQHVTDKARIDHEIDRMYPGDPMSYRADLLTSYRVLKRAHASVKHIILLGDGDAVSTLQPTIRHIRAGGVTISTVATNGLGFNDLQFMRNIAQWGGGRYYNGNNTSAIPRIFLREAKTVARSGIVRGRFYPQELSSNPMLKDLHGLAPLTGYVATTPKPAGEIVLASKKLDPVLAAWQFGLGRSVAWTSDAAGEWTRQWLQAPGANRFWADLVSWTLPASQHGKLFLNATSTQGQGRISVETPSKLGADPRVTAHVLAPDHRTSTIQMQPASPGHYEASFPAGSQGPYFITAVARAADRGSTGFAHSETGQVGLDVPYSAEYLFNGADLSFARALAKAGGGSIVHSPSSIWRNNLPTVNVRTLLAQWLWLFALLLLPIDVGVRRLIVTRRDLRAILDSLMLGGRQRQRAESPALIPLESLRRRRAVRTPRPLAPAVSVATGSSGSTRLPQAPAMSAASRSSGRPTAERTARDQQSTDGKEAVTTASALLAAKRRKR